MLSNKAFWQHLWVFNPFPLSTAMRLLRLFNKRSGYTLLALDIEAAIFQEEELDELFQELEKSSESLQVLTVIEFPDLNTLTRKKAREYLPNLKSLVTLYLEAIKVTDQIHNQWRVLSQIGLSIDSLRENVDDGKGLRHYLTDNLYDLDQEEKDYFNQLVFFQVKFPRDTQDLHTILDACKATLEALSLSKWISSPMNFTEGLEMIEMEKIEELHLPSQADLVSHLSSFIGLKRVDKEEFGLVGQALPLTNFKVPSLEILDLELSDEVEVPRSGWMEKVMLKGDTEHLFRTNPSIKHLTLSPADLEKIPFGIHLDVALEKLLIPAELDLKADNYQPLDPDGALLPKETLTIHETEDLDRRLLKKCFECRKARDSTFEIDLWKKDEGKFVGYEEWQEANPVNSESDSDFENSTL